MGVSPLFIAGGLGLAAGGLYLLWKRSQTGPTCTDACKGMTGYALVACEAACAVANNFGAIKTAVLDAASPMEADASAYEAEVNRRLAINNGINGAPAMPLLTHDLTLEKGDDGQPMADKYMPFSWKSEHATTRAPFLYANGCEPYYGAPGWAKCGAGTLDMWLMAIDRVVGEADEGWQSLGIDAKFYDESRAQTPSVFETPAQLKAATDAAQKDHDDNHSHWYQISLGDAFDPMPTDKLVKANFGTGATGDPLTQGPYVDSGGTIWWLVRGQRLSSPAGKVPKAIAMRARGPYVAGQTQADLDAEIAALTNAQAVSLIPVGSWASGGTGVSTQIDCNAVQAKDATYTWDPSNGGFWRRLKVGEKRNLGPCAGVANTSIATKAGIASGTFGFGIMGL